MTERCRKRDTFVNDPARLDELHLFLVLPGLFLVLVLLEMSRASDGSYGGSRWVTRWEL
jgi:hypothetical protein